MARQTAVLRGDASSPARDDLFAVIDGIRQINQRLRVAGRAAEQRLGVSGAQLFVLHELQRAPAHSLNELAARTCTTHSSVSVVVSKLVEAGLVARDASDADARRIVLSLTPAGRALMRRAPQSAQRRLIDGASRLPAARLAQLARGLEALLREMDAGPRPRAARRLR